MSLTFLIFLIDQEIFCMNSILKLLLTSHNWPGEKTKVQNEVSGKAQFNQDLENELKKMAELDQVAASIPKGEYGNWSVGK